MTTPTSDEPVIYNIRRIFDIAKEQKLCENKWVRISPQESYIYYNIIGNICQYEYLQKINTNIKDKCFTEEQQKQMTEGNKKVDEYNKTFYDHLSTILAEIPTSTKPDKDWWETLEIICDKFDEEAWRKSTLEMAHLSHLYHTFTGVSNP